MICVDASIVLAWLLPEEISPQAIRARYSWNQAGERLIAPAFLQVEVTSVLRSAVYRRRITEEEGDTAFRSFREMTITYLEPRSLADDAWEIARKLNAARAYDMFYVALAAAESCDLWTADQRLVNLVGDSSRVRRVGETEPGEGTTDEPA